MTKANKEGRRKAPILRFKGFTDDWEQRKLGNLFSERKEKSTKGELLSVTLSNGVVKFSDLNKKDNSNIKSGNYKVVKKSDIPYNSMRMWQGASGVSQYNGIVSPAYTVLVPNKNSNSNFYAILFKKESILNLFTRFSQGLTSDTWNLKYPILKDINVPFTNLEEQKRIFKIFNVVNNLLALYEKKKQLLTQLKQGIVNFLITKNGQKSQLRFSGFNNNWESKSFEKLLNYEQPTKYIVKKADYISQGTPVLTANKSFILGYTNENNVYQNIPAIIFDDFTLESKYVDFPFMVKSSAIKILTSKNSNLFFIYQLLNNQRFVQEGHSRHYISVVQKKKILVPSIQEQNKIGNLIKQLENNIEQNSDTIALLKSLKEFLLQNMFL